MLQHPDEALGCPTVSRPWGGTEPGLGGKWVWTRSRAGLWALLVLTGAVTGMETQCLLPGGGPGGEAELRSPPASTCPRAPKQRSRNKGALVSSTITPFWPEHLLAGLEAVPGGGSEGPFCAGMNGSLFPSGGLPPPACQAATLPGPQLHAPPREAGSALPGPMGLRGPRDAWGGKTSATVPQC